MFHRYFEGLSVAKCAGGRCDGMSSEDKMSEGDEKEQEQEAKVGVGEVAERS